MAAAAHGVLPVSRKLLTYRCRCGTGLLGQIGVHSGRRRRNRQTEYVVEQPLAAQNRRGSVRIRGCRQQRPFAKQSAALIGIRERDAAEAAAVDVGYPVVSCQPFVDERIVRIQEFRDAAVLAQRAADEELGFPLERLKKTQVIVGIAVWIDDDFLDAPQIEPLGRKVVNQRTDGPGVGQHAASFCFERRRIRELPALGQPEQTLVRDAAPQEERQSRGDLDVAQPIRVLA
jgi:hypothetical protein